MVPEDGMNGSAKDPFAFSMDDLNLSDSLLQTYTNIFLHYRSGLFRRKGMKV
jgi:hypothetical protein